MPRPNQLSKCTNKKVSPFNSCSLRAACFGSYQFAASQSMFKMTKAELQSFKAHLPKLRRRIKRPPAYSLMRSAPLPTKLQKGRRIRRPWIWEARKTEEESSHRDNPSTKQKIKIPAKTVIKFRVFKVAKDAILGVKE
jgi:hypothetical protein